MKQFHRHRLDLHGQVYLKSSTKWLGLSMVCYVKYRKFFGMIWFFFLLGMDFKWFNMVGCIKKTSYLFILVEYMRKCGYKWKRKLDNDINNGIQNTNTISKIFFHISIATWNIYTYRETAREKNINLIIP